MPPSSTDAASRRDHEERVGRPLTAEELRRALLRYSSMERSASKSSRSVGHNS